MMNYAPRRPPLAATIAEAVAFATPPAPPPDGLDALAARMPRGAGAVMVLPPLFHSDAKTSLLREFLDGLGYSAFGWVLGPNVGPTAGLMRGTEARLLELAAGHGTVAVVGFSMGGLFARWLAHGHPKKVRQVVTGCSPFREGPKSAFLPIEGVLKILPGPDLVALAADIARPLPVPGTFIYSRRDGIVAWESCLDPESPRDNAEVGCPHVTMVSDLGMFEIIARRLADPTCALAGRSFLS